MPAYFDEGFMVREPAWHKLGTVLADYPGREEAMRLAGHDFTVMEAMVQVMTGYGIVANGWKGLVRSDNLKVIGIVRDSYTVIQNDTMWDVVDELVAQPNVKYETGGVLKGGTILWVLAKLDEPVQITGDNSIILPYVAAFTGHDGKTMLKVMTTSVRVVCANTAQMANDQAKAMGTDYSFRHTANVHSRIEYAKVALGLARKEHSEFVELMETLAAKPVTSSGVLEFLERFIPEPPAAVLGRRAKDNIQAAREQVAAALASVTVAPAHKRTAYGLYCAATEYVDHLRAYNDDETYFKRTMMASPKLKQRIAKLAMTV
jgi:phage/plasmid-like protein (TIGR03299 family)